MSQVYPHPEDDHPDDFNLDDYYDVDDETGQFRLAYPREEF